MTDKPRTRSDISTVVSILPINIREFKPGLMPGEFKIPPVAKLGEFELLLVQRCRHAVYLDEARPRLIVPDPSEQVAQSIVNDFKASCHGYIENDTEPGIDWVYGEYPNTPQGKALFAAEHGGLLREMTVKQDRWFQTLVKLADDDWGKYHRHIFITKLQRLAAVHLGITNREWLMEQEINEAKSTCKFCFTMVHPNAVICPTCHGVLDQQRYDAEFKSAGLGHVGGQKLPAVVGQK